MELLLKRQYHALGCNGALYKGKTFICHTIELPWKKNRPGVSCIPAGKYVVKKRFSKKFGWHLVIQDVPQRSYILFHPANDALEELSGCIAPVSTLTAPGKGLESQVAFHKLKQIAYRHFAKREQVVLHIQ